MDSKCGYAVSPSTRICSDAKRHATPHGTFRKSRLPQKFLSYMALMSHIIDSESSNYEEVAGQ
jgi:hypothetical protein